MGRKNFIFAASVGSLCMIAFPSYGSSGTEGAAFLDIPVGAGPAALGSAYSPLAHDAYAPIYNPAGLGFVRSSQLAAQHLSYLESIHDEFGSFVMPLGGSKADATPPTSGFGVAIQYLGSGDIPGTDSSGAPIASFSAHYGAYSLSYGHQLNDKLAFGVTGKVVEAALADVSAKAYAGDLGLLFKASDKLALSGTVNNLGSKLTFTSQKDSLPMAAHVGAAYSLTRHLTAAAEAVYNKTGLMAGHFGTEWTPLEAISLRAGYKTDTTSGLSALAGLTVGVGIHAFGQELAYAWLPYGDLGDTQYFSVLLKFGAKEEERQNLIEYQSIRKHQTVHGHGKTIPAQDPEYQQLLQLLNDDREPYAEHSEK